MMNWKISLEENWHLSKECLALAITFYWSFISIDEIRKWWKTFIICFLPWFTFLVISSPEFNRRDSIRKALLWSLRLKAIYLATFSRVWKKIGKLFIAWKELKAILLSFCSSLARWCPNNLIFKEERKLRMRSLLMQKCREMDCDAINTQHVRHRRSCGWSGQQCSKSKRINNQKEIFIFSFVFVNILVVDGKTCVDFHKTAMTL